MVFRTQMFRRATIVGVGLIGGSIGMAMKKHNLATEVVGVSRKNSSLVNALKNKAIDKAYNDIKKAVTNSDFVILAAPVGSIITLLPMIGKHVKRNCIITDVGSIKAGIVAEAEQHLPSAQLFVGSHPLAGSEKMGAGFADPTIFENSMCVMTPTKKTNRLARDKVKHFWTKIGAKVTVLSPEEHDKILAYISHLPHLLAYGLMEAIPPEFLQYATQGLKDTTRIAASSPQMWNDICMSNDKNILKSLDEFTSYIAAYRKSIIAKDEKMLVDKFKGAKTKRDGVDSNG